MSKSTPNRAFGRRAGTVTVIEDRVYRSSARNARLGFIVTALIVGLLATIVASDRMHPILAVFAGLAIGFVVGRLVWTVIRIWPVLRLLWWWHIEIITATAFMVGWVQLAEHTVLWQRFAVVGVVVGVPVGVPYLRRHIVGLAYCVVDRHRLRVCFSQFIIANRSGSLPLILWARPTPIGERVWVYLRPGLSLTDLQARLDRIAVACHATSCLVEHAGDGSAAYLWFDIKRREVLTKKVKSRLVDAVDPDAPKVPRQSATVPTALDLPDVTAAAVTTLPAAATSATGSNGKKPAAAPATVASPDGDDLTDWIAE